MNIWQPASQDVRPANKDQGKHQAGKIGTAQVYGMLNILIGGRRPEGLSLALPPIGRSLSQWKTSADTEHSASRQNEPLSAQSRSYTTDSTVLTPNSLTMSDSENSAKEGNTNMNSRVGRQLNPKAQGVTEKAGLWDKVGEYQYSNPTHPSKIVSSSMFDQVRKPLVPLQPVQAGCSSINGSQSQLLNNSAFVRNGFRSVLSSQPGTLEDRDTHNDQFANGRNVYPSSLVNISNTQTALKVGAEKAHFPEFYPNSKTFGSRTQAGVTQEIFTEQYHTNQYSNNFLSGYQNLPPTTVSYPKTDVERTHPPTAVANRTYYDNSTAKNTARQHGTSIQPMPSLALQSPLYYADYIGQEVQPHPAQPLNHGFHPSVVNGVHDRLRNSIYGFNASFNENYMLPDPFTQRPNDSTQIVRSQLLEDFRVNHKSKKFEFSDIYGYIVEFSGDQLGSRFIQHKLETANSDEKDQVFSEIACDSRQLMTDVFGNYVIQKMFEHGNQSQKKVLANHMRGHVYALSTQTYGCRVVQKALEHILTDQQASLIKELDGLVIKAVENQNGNHVVQKAIERIPGEHIDFIVKAHLGHVHYLSKHPYGCRVIQRMLEHCQFRAKRAILDELHQNIGELIQDAFGNYVVQHVIVNGEARDRKPVIDKVQGRLLENAMHKFASNVVEKALDYADEEQRNAMLRKLTTRDEQGQSQVTKLLSHQYGNYVIREYQAH